MEQHAQIDPVVLSTDELDHHDRDALVREFYGRICMRLDLEAAPGQALNLKARTAILPGLSLTRGAVEPMSWERNASLMSDANDDVCLSWMAGGYLFERRGREAIERPPGAACVMSLDQAWRAQAPAGGRTVCVQISRALLETAVGEVGDLKPDAIRPETPEGMLLLDYVTAATRAPLGPALAAMVSRHVVDLVGVAVGAGRGRTPVAGRPGVRAARLRTIRQHIGENLDNPRLSAETAGRRLDISPRYIRRLFAEEGRSFSDYVTERRLATVRQRLSDPSFASKPIAEIAFEVGLVEPSTFYRQFKARYGAKPSEVRLG